MYTVTEKTLLGLIYYLKVPSDKIGQEKRFREVLSQKTAVVNSESKFMLMKNWNKS